MYWNVPRMVPFSVRSSDAVGKTEAPALAWSAPGACNFARPKSSSFAGFGQHDIAGLQVAMGNALAMRGGQCAGNLDGIFERRRNAQRAFREPRGQGLAL